VKETSNIQSEKT